MKNNNNFDKFIGVCGIITMVCVFVATIIAGLFGGMDADAHFKAVIILIAVTLFVIAMGYTLTYCILYDSAIAAGVWLLELAAVIGFLAVHIARDYGFGLRFWFWVCAVLCVVYVVVAIWCFIDS